MGGIMLSSFRAFLMALADRPQIMAPMMKKAAGGMIMMVQVCRLRS